MLRQPLLLLLFLFLLSIIRLEICVADVAELNEINDDLFSSVQL